MSSIGKYLLIAGGIVAVGGLFVKNLFQQKNLGTITKQEVLRILKIIRKQKYTLFRQIATLALNIGRQTRNNINPQMIEQFIQGPQSPIKMEGNVERITELACTLVGTTIGVYTHTLQQLKDDEDIANLIRQAQTDYKTSLTGKLPPYRVNIPASLTKDKFYQIQNQITKKTYIQQVNLFKKLKQYTQIQLQQNPTLLQEMANPQTEQEQILVEEGLGSETEPPFAVYEAATLKYYNDPVFKNKIKRIQDGYQKILVRYGPKIQNKTISDRELNQLEDEIIYFDPKFQQQELILPQLVTPSLIYK